MSKLFEEEQGVLNALLAEWYEEIKSFTTNADGIFSEKGKMYDRTSPVWERIRFPHGFVQELRKKTDRVDQLLESYGNEDEIKWEEVSEELGDIFNYSRMFGALITMYLSRKEASTLPCQTAERVHHACNGNRQPRDCLNGHPYLYQTDVPLTPRGLADAWAKAAMEQGSEELVELIDQAECQPSDYLDRQGYRHCIANKQDMADQAKEQGSEERSTAGRGELRP